MTGTPSEFSRFLSVAVVLVTVAMLVLGFLTYGWSTEVDNRFWHNIADRAHGPMTFRFILQPVMAFIAALPDGLNDARHGRSMFSWTRRGFPALKRSKLRQALQSLARVVLLGITMDVIYQMRVSDRFYPVEALVMALLLAVIPYFIFRPLIEIAGRWWFRRAKADLRHKGEV